MVRNLLVLLLVLTCLFSNEKVVSVGGNVYFENEFFEFYPKSEWERIKTHQKERILNDFIRKKTAVLEAKEQHFLENPRTAIKLRNRGDFLFVNKTYEKLVALPLVPLEYIELGKKYILKDLNISHILIGFNGTEMGGDFNRNKIEAYELASELLSKMGDSFNFDSLALSFSDDPGVTGNKGNLGWISWGKVDPDFQKEVFQLKKGDLSDPILTKYGYHIVFIKDERASEAVGFPDEKLLEKVEFSSLGIVKNQLKEAADLHDKNLIDNINFYFNEPVLDKLGSILNEHQKKITYMNNVDIVPVLKDYSGNDVIFIYNQKGYGVKWLINKLSKSSPSRRPSITNSESLRLAIKTLILQVLAIERGKTHKLNASYGYQAQYSGIEGEILYDAYVRHLVNNAPEPTDEDIKAYYEKYKETKYKEPERFSVFNLKVKRQKLADSLFVEIQKGGDFFSLAKSFSILSPKKSGKMQPFDKTKNKDIVKALKNINTGNYSKVFKTRDNKWSIIYFETMLPEEIIEYDKVKNRIKTALTKENQDSHKEDTFNNLKEKYNVTINSNFFTTQEEIN